MQRKIDLWRSPREEEQDISERLGMAAAGYGEAAEPDPVCPRTTTAAAATRQVDASTCCTGRRRRMGRECAGGEKLIGAGRCREHYDGGCEPRCTRSRDNLVYVFFLMNFVMRAAECGRGGAG
jgi:hypothetical protein